MKVRRITFALLLALVPLPACSATPPEPPSPAPPEEAPAGVPSDAVDRRILEFEEYLSTNPEPLGVVNHVADLALLRDPRVARAFFPLLRHPEDIVRIAVLQNIGRQGDPSVGVRLQAVCVAAEKEKKRNIQVAALQAIGDADARANYKFLMKQAKKFLDVDGEVACAGFRGAANWVTNDTVDDLVQMLLVADFVRDSYSPERKEARSAVRPVLMDLLKGLTGQDFQDARSWKDWWDTNKKTWRR